MKIQNLAIFFSILLSTNTLSFAYEIPILKESIIDSNKRIEYAKQLQQFLKIEILDKIPNPSPSQMEWIRNEQKVYRETNNQQRFIRALETDEFKYHILREFINDTLSNFDGIFVQDSKEFYHWTRLSSGLLHPNIWSLVLEMTEKGIISNSVLNSRSKDRYQFYIENGVHLSTGILDNIVSVNLLANTIYKR